MHQYAQNASNVWELGIRGLKHKFKVSDIFSKHIFIYVPQHPQKKIGLV
jgi:hypothetical protein